MRKEHIDILLLVIAGISPLLIECLKKAPAILLTSYTARVVDQKVKELFAINLDYTDREEIFLSLQKSEKFKSTEMAYCATLAPFFALFCRCIPSVSSDIADRILSCSFGDSDAMHCCLRDALHKESIPKSSTIDLFSFTHVAHPTLCNHMFKANLIIPDEGIQYAMHYYVTQVINTIDATILGGNVSFTEGATSGDCFFRQHISAMRSITSKGLYALELRGTGSWCKQQYIWQLLNLLVKLEVISIDQSRTEMSVHLMTSTLGDVCWLEEDAISDYLSAVPYELHTSCMHVYVGIATLFHLSSLMADEDGDDLIFAIKFTIAVLSTRVYLAELVSFDVLSTSEFSRIHSEALSFGEISLQTSNASTLYKPSSIIELLKAVTHAVESTLIVDEKILWRSTLLIMQMQRLWTLLNEPVQRLLRSLTIDPKVPSNLQVLQCSLIARTRNEILVYGADWSTSRPCVVIPLMVMVAVLNLQLRSRMYSVFIEFLVIDFALLIYSVKFEKHRLLSAMESSNVDPCCSSWDDWQQNQEVVNAVHELPDRSSYKRQVSSCVFSNN